MAERWRRRERIDESGGVWETYESFAKDKSGKYIKDADGKYKVIVDPKRPRKRIGVTTGRKIIVDGREVPEKKYNAEKSSRDAYDVDWRSGPSRGDEMSDLDKKVFTTFKPGGAEIKEIGNRFYTYVRRRRTGGPFLSKAEAQANVGVYGWFGKPDWERQKPLKSPEDQARAKAEIIRLMSQNALMRNTMPAHPSTDVKAIPEGQRLKSMEQRFQEIYERER